jgi:hypothetical protein
VDQRRIAFSPTGLKFAMLTLDTIGSEEVGDDT